MSLDATTTYPATDPTTTPDADAAPPLSHADLRQLVDTIHTMQEVDQYQVFELIQQDTNKYTENRNGVFVNLSHLDDATLQKLATFVQYWTIQREAIAKTEAESKSLAAQFSGANPDDEAGGVAAGGTAAGAHAEGHRGHGRGGAGASGVGTGGSAPAHPTSAAHAVATDAQRERESTKTSAVVANELTEAERDLVKVSVENRRISLHKGKKHRFEGSAARVARKCLHSSDDGNGA
jgi:hypothetical protein